MASLPLHTPRFTITPLTAADREAFIAYRNEPDVARHQGWELPYTPSDADKLLSNQSASFPPAPGEWLQLAIHSSTLSPSSTSANVPTSCTALPSSISSIPSEDCGASLLLGDVAVRTHPSQPNTYEIGVTISPAAQRTGVGAEALKTLVEALFTHGAHRITACSDVHNPAVGGLLRKVGFTLEGTAREADWFKGEWQTLQYWSLLESDRRL